MACKNAHNSDVLKPHNYREIRGFVNEMPHEYSSLCGFPQIVKAEGMHCWNMGHF
jgi:hypothetical protein